MPASDPDLDETDNALQLSMAGTNAEIIHTGFVQGENGSVQLQAMILNTGGAPLDSITVSAGATTQTFTEIPIGSTRQFVMDGVEPEVFYTVTVTDEICQLLSTDMLCYPDPNAAYLEVQSVTITDIAAQVLLSAQEQTAAGTQVIFVLYQGGKLLHADLLTMENINGSNTCDFIFENAPAAGSYDHKRFFLANDGTLAPHLPARSGVVTVS